MHAIAGCRAALRADVTWRFAQRHELQLMYFGSDRSARPVISGKVDYGDATYPAGALVEARFASRVLELGESSGNFRDHQMSLVWQATRRIGVGAGYDVFRLRTDIDDPGSFVGRVKWGYEGAQVFLRTSF